MGGWCSASWGYEGSGLQSPCSSERAGLRCSLGWHLPMTDVNSSGAELPAAMNVAPATSSLRCRRCKGAKAQVSWDSFQNGGHRDAPGPRLSPSSPPLPQGPLPHLCHPTGPRLLPTPIPARPRLLSPSSPWDTSRATCPWELKSLGKIQGVPPTNHQMPRGHTDDKEGRSGPLRQGGLSPPFQRQQHSGPFVSPNVPVFKEMPQSTFLCTIF